MRAVLSVISLCLLALAVPLAASAGWAGSPYEKSDCTYTKETNFLYCERIDMREKVKTEILGLADETCVESGTRRVERTGTHVEPTLVFDSFAGRTPHEKWLLGGNDVPLLGQEFWKDFTDRDLGCYIPPS